jgi:S-adenosylmethionine:tRNA ribosyltransferase-isomerase
MYQRAVRTADFDYELPEELIARHPAEARDAARLLVVDRATEKMRHLTFVDLPEVLRGDEVVVLNDTRVLPARLHGRRLPGGGHVELLLVRPTEEGPWVALGRANKPLRPGTEIELPGNAGATVVQRKEDGSIVIALQGADDVPAYLRAHGSVPLPPYLGRKPIPEDGERYQTVYAANDGAVAAPTAGLHFTPAVLDALRSRGCHVVTVTLHVGPGTFRPLTTEDPRDHRLDPEDHEIPEATADAVELARAEGRPVLAVGTTVVRTLEHVAAHDPEGRVRAGRGRADLLIHPGRPPKVVSRLLTNFHLPRTSLLLLVSALAGRELVFEAYAEAVRRRYRFYSYGDATLWL